jgi:hypothetical protein
MTTLAPYPVGPLPAAGVTLLGPPQLQGRAPLTRETSYPVRYDCCGRETTLSHRTLAERGARGRRLCPACERRAAAAARRAGGQVSVIERAWGYYPAGTALPAAGVTVLRLAMAGTTQRTAWYAVRYHCCGREDHLNHLSLRRRLRLGQHRCGPCGQIASGAAAGARWRAGAARRQAAAAAGDASAITQDQKARAAAALARQYPPASAWPIPASLRGQPPWWPGREGVSNPNPLCPGG